MISDSGLGLFDVVVVHKLDRFSETGTLCFLQRQLKKNGVRLIRSKNLDDSPESIILESVMRHGRVLQRQSGGSNEGLKRNRFAV